MNNMKFFADNLPRNCSAEFESCVTEVFEKTCVRTQKNVKSHVFLDFEKKPEKRKNVRIVSQAT